VLIKLLIKDYVTFFVIILLIFNYFTEKDTAKKRKRGRACRKIAPIMERTSTSKSPTGSSKVTLPTLVKGIKNNYCVVILFYTNDLLLGEIENETTLV